MNITIKDLPKPPHQRLKKASAQSGGSLNKFIIYTLEKSVFPVRQDRAALLERIRRTRRAMKVTIDEDSLYQAIHEGRE
jgi:hypothetical protein